MTLSVSHAALARPNHPALIDTTRTVSFAALAEATGALARALPPADHGCVLVIGHRDIETAIGLCALLERRQACAIADPKWSPRELNDALARLRPRAIVDRGAIFVRSDARSHDAQALLFTSATTGRAKIVRLSRSALEAAARMHARAFPFAPEDRWWLSLSPARIGGLSILTRSLWARSTVVVADGLEALASHRVSIASMVPTQLRRALDHPAPPLLRLVLVGGAACDDALVHDARARGWPCILSYGLTETAAQVCAQRLGDSGDFGVGQPLPGVEIRIENQEIEIRSPTLMDGYLDEPDHVGWLRTGDLGRWSAQGHLEVIGRADDRILSGGERVDPHEVEDALRRHPRIEDALVVGITDATWGQIVGALLVGPGVANTPLRAHLDEHLARFKHPRRFLWCAAIPTTAAGKPDRRLARDTLARSAPSSVSVPVR